jgi:hypothetical protein
MKERRKIVDCKMNYKKKHFRIGYKIGWSAIKRGCNVIMYHTPNIPHNSKT